MRLDSLSTWTSRSLLAAAVALSASCGGASNRVATAPAPAAASNGGPGSASLAPRGPGGPPSSGALAGATASGRQNKAHTEGAAAAHGTEHRRTKRPKRTVHLPELSDHQSALERQLGATWGSQDDRDGQAHFPLVDHQNWKRVRFRGVPHFTGFTYGQDHDLVSSAFVLKTQGKPTSRRCMSLFEDEAMRQYDSLGGRHSSIKERRAKWQNQELIVHTGDGELAVLFNNYRFSVAWAAYPAYSDGCIIYATVVLWGDHPGLAQKVRDRWAREGFQRYVAMTPVLPARLTN